jgi:nucleoside-diphosphate-sugar epimerase
MPRVLVAGGAGFVGSHLCRALVARGDGVVAVDNFVTGRHENVADLVDDDRFTLVEHDIVEPFPAAVTDCGAFDAVLQLASPASPLAYLSHPVLTLETGSVGTKRALDVARRDGARFLLASTSEVYGDPTVHPQPETYWGYVNPLGVRAVYDESKRYAEAMAMTYHREFGVDVKIARLFNTYGPGLAAADGRVVSNLLAQALAGLPLTVYGDGTQTRSLCYVADTVDGLLALLDSDFNGAMNIGNPDERTVLELAKIVLELTGSTSEIVFEPLPADDPTRRCPDIALARRVLGWTPTTDLREGLARLRDWYRNA